MKSCALGCLADIALFVVFAAIAGEDMTIGAIAYFVVLLLPVLTVRGVMALTGAVGRRLDAVLGPVVAAAAMLLAWRVPIDSLKDDAPERQMQAGGAAKAAPPLDKRQQAAGAAKAAPPLADVPPGVKYVAADEAASLEDALEELNSLIGLAEVKAEVAKFAKFVRVAQMRQAEGLKVAPVTYHMVFTGNPGTGKTTVARIMAKIYRALGIVKKGHLVETDRGGLIAEYVGQTAVKTGKVIDFAMDGVLFIDEAYAITEGSNQGYGAECIATLLKRMEDDRDRLVVIVAGYTDEMKTFIDSNPGLQSRFNRYIHFPDYSAEELAAIFRMNAKKAQYVLSDDVERWLDPAMARWTKDRTRKFGNGRFVRNLFEKAVERQAVRVAEMENPTKADLMTITMADMDIPQ